MALGDRRPANLRPRCQNVTVTKMGLWIQCGPVEGKDGSLEHYLELKETPSYKKMRSHLQPVLPFQGIVSILDYWELLLLC